MSNQPIIIRRTDDDGHGDHHGGGWKVAYADFMTAMMAFFLLMWIISSSSEEKLRGLADYFTPSVLLADGSGSGALDGEAVEAENARSLPEAPPEPELPTFGQDNPLAVFDSRLREDAPEVVVEYEPAPEPAPAAEPAGPTAEDIRQQRLAELETEIVEELASRPEIAELAGNLQFDITEEGLRMQIVDHAGRSMFPSGSAQVGDETRELIGLIGEAIRDLPNPVVISGHTDAVPFSSGASYGNWELSADRANATRRILLDTGVAPERVVRISGLAATEPLDPARPDAPENRRISVLLQYPRGAE